MAIINKITEFRPIEGLTEANIQAHIDELNTDGWNLIALSDLVGWYRFFWSKEV